MKIRQGFAALPLPHPSSPSLFFSFFWIFSEANEGVRGSQHLYRVGGAGRPAGGRPGPATPLPGGWSSRDLDVIFCQFSNIYFYIFYFRFLQKYIFVFEIYMNIRPAVAARQRGGRVLSAKKVDKKLRRGPWRTGRPAAGRPALQATRQRSGVPWPPACGAPGPQPYIRCWLSLTPSFASLKIQKKRKKRDGGRGKAAKPCRIFKPATVGN